MSLLLQLLTVAAVIAVLIALKMLIQRLLIRQRLAGQPGTDCDDRECFGGCSGLKPNDKTPT